MTASFIENLKERAALVTIDGDGYVSMRVGDGRQNYEFEVVTTGDALRWVQHVAQKSWCTTDHLMRFAALAADLYGVRYR